MINYYNTDNLQFMKSIPDNAYDLVIADPAYGLKQHGGTNRSHNVVQKDGSVIHVQDGGYKKKEWDNTPPAAKYFEQLFRISKHQIIWGEQYLSEDYGKGRIIWDKVNDGSDQNDCEIAFCSLDERVNIFRYMWRGMMQGLSIEQGHIQQGNKKLNEKRIHPTQKPTALYAWILKKYDIPRDWKIFDPNLGSGSIGIACYKMGYSLDACEIDNEYYSDALERLNNEMNFEQGGLFITS